MFLVVEYGICPSPIPIRFNLKIIISDYPHIASGYFYDLIASIEVDNYVKNIKSSNNDSYLEFTGDLQTNYLSLDSIPYPMCNHRR